MEWDIDRKDEVEREREEGRKGYGGRGMGEIDIGAGSLISHIFALSIDDSWIGGSWIHIILDDKCCILCTFDLMTGRIANVYILYISSNYPFHSAGMEQDCILPLLPSPINSTQSSMPFHFWPFPAT